jgi:hypothetical protein
MGDRRLIRRVVKYHKNNQFVNNKHQQAIIASCNLFNMKLTKGLHEVRHLVLNDML